MYVCSFFGSFAVTYFNKQVEYVYQAIYLVNSTCSGNKTGLQRTRKLDFFHVNHCFQRAFVLTENVFKK